MTIERDRVLDRVADLLDPAPDILDAVYRRVERRQRNRRVGGMIAGGLVGAAVIAALVAVGVRLAGDDAVPADRPLIKLTSSAGQHWSLFATPARAGHQITVGGPDRSMTISLDVPEDFGADGIAFTAGSTGGSSFIVGVVGSEVASVTHIEQGHHVDVPLSVVPSDRAASAQGFIVPMTGRSAGWLVARDRDALALQTVEVSPGVTCGVTTSCASEPRSTVLVDSADDGTSYQVVVRDGAVVVVDSLGTERGRVVDPTDGRVELAPTDITNRDLPVVLGVASGGLTDVVMVGTFDGRHEEGMVDAPVATLADGRVVFLAYRYATYFDPDMIVVTDPACSTSVAFGYPSLAPATTPMVEGCR